MTFKSSAESCLIFPSGGEGGFGIVCYGRSLFQALLIRAPYISGG